MVSLELWSLVLLYIGTVQCDYLDPHCGGKQVIVHLFEWKWTDIAKECENYLGPMGFCGVQVSPPNEHAVITNDAPRPWWERYQPVSYKLTSRSGNEQQFKDMVSRCKTVGVRIYVDAVINHMTGLGRQGKGTAGTSYNADNFDYPGVPYTRANFNDRSKCPSADGNINNYGDPNNVRNCYLVGLTDLDGGQDYVRTKISGYFNHLIDLGVAGFRIDAAKHMWPQDIAAIQAKTKDLPEGGRPFFWLEVIDRNDGAVKNNDYFGMGYITEFRYCQKIKEGISNYNRLNSLYDPGWGMTPSDKAFVFVDNHDNQRGNDALTFNEPNSYKHAVAFTLAYNYGFTRIMSSYRFNDFSQGPPHNADFSIKDVVIKSDGSCDNGWVCEHRWPAIGRMAAFRNAVAGESVDNWRYADGAVSFNRGQKGFFAMGKSQFTTTVNTGLRAGEYCDLISACAMKVHVDSNGNAKISPYSSEDPFVAIITSQNNGKDVGTGTMGANSKQTNSDSNFSMSEAKTTVASEDDHVTEPYFPDFKRTIIMVERPTVPGQDLFIRGGIDHKHRAGCTSDPTTSKCSIPIHHITDGTGQHYRKVNAWSKGDNYLDWSGAEAGQGTYNGQVAQGTPAYWSTNDPSQSGHNELNTYGQHYWIVDVQMDCASTDDGFFEVKAVVNGQWENNIPTTTCTGADAEQPPYTSINHFARCGYKNVFHFNKGTCGYEKL